MFDDIPIPKARAGKARFNLYRKGLTDKQLRTLAQASKRQGLRDEASYLRLLLEEARAEGRKEDVLKIMLALARVEEADSRINMRQNRYPDEEGGSQLFQLTRYMFDRLTALFPAAVPTVDSLSLDDPDDLAVLPSPFAERAIAEQGGEVGDAGQHDDEDQIPPLHGLERGLGGEVGEAAGSPAEQDLFPDATELSPFSDE